MQKVQTDEFKILLFGNTYISQDVGNWLCLVKRLRWATPVPSWPSCFVIESVTTLNRMIGMKACLTSCQTYNIGKSCGRLLSCKDLILYQMTKSGLVQICRQQSTYFSNKKKCFQESHKHFWKRRKYRISRFSKHFLDLFLLWSF